MKTLITLFLVFTSFTTMASEPRGYYNEGSLVDAECLPETGDGFIQHFREIGQYWGTTEMIDMLERTASEMARKYPGKDRLQIEDISAKNGGDIEPHGSHENGLDVDIQYFKSNGVEHVPRFAGDYAPKMVVNGSVSSNFDLERNWELMKTLHRHGSVQLIFVDQKLKDAMVDLARQKGEYNSNLKVINSLRHSSNHEDHMHVRLNCPATARGCHSTTKKKGGGV